MMQVQRKPMNGAEFLAWEAMHELKWEFDGEQPVAMVGVTDAHGAIQLNLMIALGTRLRGTRGYPRGPECLVENIVQFFNRLHESVRLFSEHTTNKVQHFQLVRFREMFVNR